ncbi:hypothetical protein A2773_03220 [Candidatus Gottesmanbacteria bacterium RIFCSPHIGHO2_01_FULL_39_10]|uniref:Enoyl reductase (ER) domain-containing protein n=1 Tax=Candidatus Gottesmanbacteria bacterium RIFCSPHIGHO2_01_FULL_39_10 TaxID=1798375 RepID=A0A1F5ZN20_9BACT|nr:MAG: hypothetical protein A2773_03220 [Candidatus Gottesmanbacteria bacterium RIFCSPHIGHO2_01_FULL_39_10]
MKKAVFSGPFDLKIEEVPRPKIGPQDVLLKIKKVGICGTDIHIYKGSLKTPLPLVLGHEFVGDIIEIGKQVTRFKIGQKAVAEHVLGCGMCRSCKEGKINLCNNSVAIGINTDGALQEYLSLPQHLVFPLPPSLSYDDGVLVEPISIAVYAAKKATLKKGETVAVIGQGPIGLLIDTVVQAAKARVHGYDIENSRLDYAVKKGLINESFNTREKLTSQKESADKVFEVVGLESTLTLALDLVKKGGKIVILGVFHKPVSLNMMTIIKNELEIIGSWTCRDSFPSSINLLTQKKLNTKGFITHHYPFSQTKQAFEDTLKYPSGRIKTVIEF